MGGDEREGGLQFRNRSEAVAGSGDEEGGCAEVREVLCPELQGLPGRMQRVREQEQSIGEAWGIGSQHGGHASAIGVTAEEDVLGCAGATESFDCGKETSLVARGGAEGRSCWALLAEGQIAAQDGYACGGECIGESDQQRRIAVGAG